MKHFTETDVEPHGSIPGAGSLSINYPADLVLAQLPWQKLGLQQTTTGYGAKLTGSYKISYCGKLYRIYHTCYGNSSSPWFIANGRKIFVH